MDPQRPLLSEAPGGHVQRPLRGPEIRKRDAELGLPAVSLSCIAGKRPPGTPSGFADLEPDLPGSRRIESSFNKS
jgi:hypothetical protein